MEGLSEITVAGQKVGLKFGMPAVRRFFEKSKEVLLMADGNYTDLGLAHLTYAGYLNFCIMKDRIPAIEFESFYDLLENPGEQTKDEMISAVRIFEESKFVKPIVDEKKKEEEKKKVQEKSNGMPLNHSAMESSDSLPATTLY